MERKLTIPMEAGILSQKQFAPTDWVEELSKCIEVIIDYERQLEEGLFQLQVASRTRVGHPDKFAR